MNEQELISYFNENLIEIFNSKTAKEIDFISLCLEDSRIQDLIKKWPKDLKTKIVKDYLAQEDILNTDISEETSWSDYYEMYDGKFDEVNMLHIIVKKERLSEIISLGYKLENNEVNGNLSQAGEYKLDRDGNIILVHSCPDREIFGGDLNQHLEELGIKEEWITATSLSAI